METPTQPADPNTVLTADVVNVFSKLQVATRSQYLSEPTTPSESPQSLDSGMRDWLTETLLESGVSATNPRVYVKMLVSNAAAGSIIGKGGSNINDLQGKTYARIQLSKAAEYYPGTQERALLVAGRLKQVIAALALILEKLLREGAAPLAPASRNVAGKAARKGSEVDARVASDASLGAKDRAAEDDGVGEARGPLSHDEAGSPTLGGGPDLVEVGAGASAGADAAAEGQAAAEVLADPEGGSSSPAAETGSPSALLDPPRLLLKVLVPQSLCGIIIGKNGVTIRAYAAETQTSIRVVSTEIPMTPLTHRTVTVCGTQDAALRAVALLVLKQAEDQHFPAYGELPPSFVDSPGTVLHGAQVGAVGFGLGPGGPFASPAAAHAHAAAHGLAGYHPGAAYMTPSNAAAFLGAPPLGAPPSGHYGPPGTPGGAAYLQGPPLPGVYQTGMQGPSSVYPPIQHQGFSPSGSFTSISSLGGGPGGPGAGAPPSSQAAHQPRGGPTFLGAAPPPDYPFHQLVAPSSGAQDPSIGEEPRLDLANAAQARRSRRGAPQGSPAYPVPVPLARASSPTGRRLSRSGPGSSGSFSRQGSLSATPGTGVAHHDPLGAATGGAPGHHSRGSSGGSGYAPAPPPPGAYVGPAGVTIALGPDQWRAVLASDAALARTVSAASGASLRIDPAPRAPASRTAEGASASAGPGEDDAAPTEAAEHGSVTIAGPAEAVAVAQWWLFHHLPVGAGDGGRGGGPASHAGDRSPAARASHGAPPQQHAAIGHPGPAPSGGQPVLAHTVNGCTYYSASGPQASGSSFPGAASGQPRKGPPRGRGGSFVRGQGISRSGSSSSSIQGTAPALEPQERARHGSRPPTTAAPTS